MTVRASSGRPPAAFWIFVLLVAIGLLRIVLTYRAVAQTIDETPNIACGMQWLDQGRYDLGPFHPPLARIAMAIGPYLYGLRSQGVPDRWKEGNAVLHSHGKYAVALTLARIGILPFFILAATCVWLWSRRILGEWGALVAVFLFTNLPMVLAHSGIATTDMAVTAGIVFALYRFTRWMEQPDSRRSVLLGVAAAMAFLAKFSAFLVVPLCALCILILYLATARKFPPVRLKMLALSGGVAFLLLWAGYRFAIGRMQEPVDSGLAASSPVWAAISRIPLPASQVPDGLLLVRVLNRDGHPAYLFGELRQTGWWYFFPVAMAVKTPLAILILSAIGLFAAFRRPLRWQLLAPAVCTLAILAACLPSHLNTGLRYILCLFPMLSIVAAQGVMLLWERNVGHLPHPAGSGLSHPAGSTCCQPRWGRRFRLPTSFRGSIPKPIAAALLLWLAVSSLRAHPDYIPYFNELAASHPERILVDSDLDWGQDVKRLVWKLRELHVEHVYFACLWSGDDSKIGLPAWDGLEAYQPVTGWVAISYTTLKTRGLLLAQSMGRREPAFAWLDRYQPVYKVGKSILLYHIPN